MSLTIRLPENVYRYPYEFCSAASYSAAMLAATLMPLPGISRYAVIPVLGGLAVKRYFEGKRIRRYRKNVKNLPYYAATPDQIPVSDKALFLGKGFRWTQKHTQRLMMIRQPENDHLRLPGKLYKAARLHEIKTPGETWLTKLTSSNAWWNPVAPYLLSAVLLKFTVSNRRKKKSSCRWASASAIPGFGELPVSVKPALQK
ncbi:hypothetical protein [Neisseria yangbaofengii]|uniref:hypothetical protein n=1 Tax=Neisseria yangbaofengii TaxID=2709396 RepID=UPI001F153C76|nr:hypothetical protein [Neisseria yangbaofengii]